MKIDLDKNEITLLKSLLKKEFADFKEDEEDVDLTNPHITQLALEENYKDFIKALIKKLE